MEHFGHRFNVVKCFSQVIFCWIQWWKHPICQCISSRLPALFCGIFFWREFWEVFQLDIFMLSKIFSDFCACMRLVVVNEEQVFIPSSSKFVQEFEKLFLSFLFCEWVDEALFAVFMIDFDNRMASPSSPPSRYDGVPTINPFSPSFFLNCAISSSLGCW